MTASLLFNTRPRYLPPLDLIPWTWRLEQAMGLLPIPLSRIIAASEARTGLPLIRIPTYVTRLGEVAATIESELATRGDALWKDEIFLGLLINPLAHHLFDQALQTASVSPPLDQALASIRLGVIVWIIWVKRMCQSWPGPPMAYVAELLDLLSMQSDWNPGTTSDVTDDILSVRLWLSVICGVASCPRSRERKTAVTLIADNSKGLDRYEWAEVMVHVRRMPWISSFETQLAGVRDDIQLLHVH